MKTIVVTGAAGLVGQNLVPMLVEKGYAVRAIDRNQHNLALLQKLNPSVATLCADLAVPGDWEKVLHNADTVIQLQAQIAAKSTIRFVRSNITSVRRVIEACAQNKVKHLIHLSSSVVISAARDDYTNTKKAGEELVRKSRIPHTILRPPLMYGCFDAKHLGWITRLMERWPVIPVPGSGDYVRQPLYVKDLCHVILSCIERKPRQSVWNIIGHEKISYINLLRIIAQTRGWRRIFLPVPLPLFSAMLSIYGFLTGKVVFTPDQMKALIAGDKFPVENWTGEFGVRATPFREGIWRTWHGACVKYAKEMQSPH